MAQGYFCWWSEKEVEKWRVKLTLSNSGEVRAIGRGALPGLVVSSVIGCFHGWSWWLRTSLFKDPWHHPLAAMNVAYSSMPLSLENCSQQNGSVVTWESCYPILQVAMANDRLTQGTEGWSLFLRGGTVLWFSLYSRIPCGIRLKLDPSKTSWLLHSFHYPILLSSFLFSVPEEITCLRILTSGFRSEECNLRWLLLCCHFLN